MQASIRRWIQAFLAAALLLVSARLLWITYQRQRPFSPARRAARPSARVHPDYYVHPPRSYLTDLNSARRLKGSAVWVRDGYRYAHFPFDLRTRHSREIKDPPLLPPLRKITIADVLSEPTPQAGTDEINLVFEDPGSLPPQRAVTIGHCRWPEQSCRFYFDEIFFLRDPRTLYSHWTPETWEAIKRGEVKEGMSETKISFAVGYGRPLPKETAQAGGARVLEFRPPGRPPLVVTFGADGNALRIKTEP